MKLSTKGRYAMVALADLALAKPEELVSLSEISKRQDISLPYLEQLFVKLRRAGLVEAVRGPGGGYRLAKPPAEIRVSEVMEAVEETVNAMHTGAGASGGVSAGGATRRGGGRGTPWPPREDQAQLQPLLVQRSAAQRGDIARAGDRLLR